MTYVEPDKPEPTSEPTVEPEKTDEETENTGDGPSSHDTAGQFPADEVASSRQSDEYATGGDESSSS